LGSRHRGHEFRRHGNAANADGAGYRAPEARAFHRPLWSRQTAPEFAKLFDDTLRDIAISNNDIFAVKTDGGAKITLFDRVSEFITDTSKRDAFCRAIINKLGDFSFERIFNEKYDFYAALFEYLIKDYNKDSGGKYAEYYTPHAVAKIMAAILVPEAVRGKSSNVSCYDPSAGSGTLLMNIAHAIGEQRCSIYSQDISQKSSSLLRLNLILNNLVHSIPNIIQGNTMLHPYHREAQGQGQKNALKKFDYIVSNPPFKMDFSDFRNELDSKEHRERFFAGVPNIPKQAVDKMAIYQLFLQHIIYSLKPGGKAAVVVPTGFITAQSGIDKGIRQHLVDNKMLAGVVSMPSNIFATTGTNVSILFVDRSNQGERGPDRRLRPRHQGQGRQESENSAFRSRRRPHHRHLQWKRGRGGFLGGGRLRRHRREELQPERRAVFRRKDRIQRPDPGTVRHKDEGFY
jgi:type I restriction enzyme M protein